MTAPMPMTAWQESNTPAVVPLYIRRSIEPGPDGCWLWTLGLNRDGYGLVSYRNKTHQAHRLIYRLTKGDPGRLLDHKCRVRRCVNPEHLEPVTPLENLIRSPIAPAGQERCLRCGGEFTRTGRQRRCIPCARARELVYQRERRRRLAEVAS